MDPNSPQNKATNADTSTHNDQTSPKTAPPPPFSSPTPREYVRSYTCTFCEKGFSNAQALGGHMNIHRRDRARLRNLDDSELDTRRSSWDRRLQTTSLDEHDPRVLWLFGGHNPRGDEVDLELRLGMEPSTSSSSSSSARKGP